MLKLNYFSGETFDCIAFSSFKDIFFVTEVFKVVLLIDRNSDTFNSRINFVVARRNRYILIR